jgi:hypothetical protein
MDSVIVSEFQPLFEEFRSKCFNLLWRGSRDGSTAQEFHLRCDGRANTLTLTADTDGNVFGGFTPAKWESSAPGEEGGHSKGDDSGRSFLFTLRNPHGVPPRKVALEEEKKWRAIYCSSEFCAVFGDCIYVCDNCNTNRDSYSFTQIGTNWGDRTYANDTAFEDFFTGALLFTVKGRVDKKTPRGADAVNSPTLAC